MQKDSRIYVAGHTGLVGSNVLKVLEEEGYNNIITATHKEVNLRNKEEAEQIFKMYSPEYVVMAAAKVGGISANMGYPADFLQYNLEIQTNVLNLAREYEVKRLVFISSGCAYPKDAPTPTKEAHFLTGPLEPSNDAYAVAKIAGMTMCQAINRQYRCDFVSVVPPNLYGPEDHFTTQGNHVVPALMRKIHDATQDKRNIKVWGNGVTASYNTQKVEVWGDGTPIREFLHAYDLAKAIVFILNYVAYPFPHDIINVGSGESRTIKDIAYMLADIIGYKGGFKFDDTSKLNGVSKKLLDSSIINTLGWKPKFSLEEGLKKAYKEAFKC